MLFYEQFAELFRERFSTASDAMIDEAYQDYSGSPNAVTYRGETYTLSELGAEVKKRNPDMTENQIVELFSVLMYEQNQTTNEGGEDNGERSEQGTVGNGGGLSGVSVQRTGEQGGRVPESGRSGEGAVGERNAPDAERGVQEGTRREGQKGSGEAEEAGPAVTSSAQTNNNEQDGGEIVVSEVGIMSNEALMKLKKIYQAKTYIDDMCQGIDPVSKKPVPEDSVIRQEQVVDCFAFISELLDEMLMPGDSQEALTVDDEVSICDDTEELTKKEKEPFKISAEQIAQVKTTHSTLAISTFIKRINYVIDRKTTKSIRTKDIHGWLTAKGFLEERSIQIIKEEKEYFPSQYADAIGVIPVAKPINDGQQERHSIKLNSVGQQFILDNIEEIAEYAKQNS